jgi:hypothetical protein
MNNLYFGISNRYMKTILVLILASFAYTVSFAQDKPLTIRLDPSNAMGASASQVFEHIKYIPLETTKKSVFGQISDMEITDDLFIIFDEQTNAILLFRKDGKFYSRISGGPKPSDKIRLFHVDRFSREIQFAKAINGQPIKYYYDFDGKKKREAGLTINEHYYFRYAEFPGSAMVGQRYVSDDNLADSTAYELTVETNKKQTAAYLPYNTKKSPLNRPDVLPYFVSPFFRTASDTVLYYTRYWDYSVYKITPHTFQQQLEFIFPLEYSLPTGFLTDTTLRGKRMNYVQTNKQAIYLIPNVLFMPGSILVKFKNNQPPTDPTLVLDNTFYLYNLKSGLLVDAFKIVPDDLNWRLPIVDRLGYVNLNARAYSDGNYLYTSVSSLSMFLSADQNMEKNIKYEKTMANYFKTQNRKNNPVIVQLELKQ